MIDEKVLIERLEELLPFATMSGDYIRKKDVIRIVNQLAEEHNFTPCYLGSPCEYQNENAMLPNELLADDNGWIACLERLPEENDWYYTTLNYRNAVDSGICKFVDGKWSCSEEFEVIAWQYRPAPYMAKQDKQK